MAEKTDKLGQLIGQLRPSTWDPETRTVEVTLGRGAAVHRYDWTEGVEYTELIEFSSETFAVPEREQRGIPVLLDHERSVRATVGRTIPGTLRVVDGEALVTIRLSAAKKHADILADIADGIIGDVSFGYRPTSVRESPDQIDNLPTVIVDGLELLEVSLVGVRADPTAGIRSAQPETTNTPTQEEAIMPQINDQDRAAVESTVTAPQPIQTPEVTVDYAPRNAELRQLARSAGTDSRLLDSLIDSKQSLDEARAALFADWAQRQEAAQQQQEVNPVTNRVNVTTDAGDRVRSALADAVFSRISGQQPTEAGAVYRYASLLDMAKETLEIKGISTRGRSPDDILDMAMRGEFSSPSDFKALLADSQNKHVRLIMANQAPNFEAFAQRREVPDFKVVSEVDVSGLGKMTETLPGAEVRFSNVFDGKESWQLKTYTSGIGLTRQAIINDDLGVLTRDCINEMQAVNQLKLDTFWGVFDSNPTLASDGQTVYHAAKHGNYTATGGAPSVDEIAKGRESLRKQKDKHGSFLNLIPTHIVVGPGYETLIDQFYVNLSPDKPTNAIPAVVRSLTPIVEPRITDGRFYLVAASQKSIVYGVLRGQDMPHLTSWWDERTDVLQFKIRYDFAVKYVDYRGVYRNDAQG